MTHPVELHAARPERYDRVQVAMRLAVLVAIGALTRGGGGLTGLAYLLLPVAAAILLPRSQGGGPRTDDGPGLLAVVRWVVALYGYLMFVTDAFPITTRPANPSLTVHPSGSPTVGTALARLVTSLPHFVVLAFLGVAASVVSFVIAVGVLVRGRCGQRLHAFQVDVLAWLARVLAYHASLVEEYPPFHLGSDHSPEQAPQGA